MSLADCSDSSDVIKEFGLHKSDCGSPEVQIALLTKRLETLGEHFTKHGQDKHSRHGLLKIVSKRKRLLTYLKGENLERYKDIITKLGLRK